jgi:hypothetical protein
MQYKTKYQDAEIYKDMIMKRLKVFTILKNKTNILLTIKTR